MRISFQLGLGWFHTVDIMILDFVIRRRHRSPTHWMCRLFLFYFYYYSECFSLYFFFLLILHVSPMRCVLLSQCFCVRSFLSLLPNIFSHVLTFSMFVFQFPLLLSSKSTWIPWHTKSSFRSNSYRRRLCACIKFNDVIETFFACHASTIYRPIHPAPLQIIFIGNETKSAEPSIFKNASAVLSHTSIHHHLHCSRRMLEYD